MDEVHNGFLRGPPSRGFPIFALIGQDNTSNGIVRKQMIVSASRKNFKEKVSRDERVGRDWQKK